jgi:hypothetical protein
MKKKINWKNYSTSKTYLFIIGLSATLWFLIRVIPKPSRARYPCMQAAAPLMSSFIIYLLGVSAGVFSYKQFKKAFSSSRYVLGSLFLLVSVGFLGFVLLHDQKDAIARALNPLDNTFPVESNRPLGEAKGLFPGRVVWVHDPAATNENYTPTRGSSDYWYSNENTNEEVIRNMLKAAILEYAAEEDISSAWDAIFKSFNSSAGKGEIGYTAGEKIAFKINLTNESANSQERPQRMDATPQLLNAILYELTENVGVEQKDIILGDPYREFRQEYINLVMSKFPNVEYVDGDGGNGVIKTSPTETEELVFSDKNIKSTLPGQYLVAEYVINIPCLKTHNEGGITLISKNHQGSFLEKGDAPESQFAIAMHYSLPKNDPGIGKYRHTVDYMGHKDTGGKALIYIIDGIWAGQGWEGWIQKFKSDPFNNDYPNSILVGQDPVALESVGFDILFQEYVEDASKERYPIEMKAEIADYLAQCASSDYWPEGIVYDPEGDGTPLESLGVFEHWNNPVDRQYSRNLGTGDGIELKYILEPSLDVPADRLKSINICSPNPFTDYAEFRKPDNLSDKTRIEIYSLNGRKVSELAFMNNERMRWDGHDANGNPVPAGLYFYRVIDSQQPVIFTGKILRID